MRSKRTYMRCAYINTMRLGLFDRNNDERGTTQSPRTRYRRAARVIRASHGVVRVERVLSDSARKAYSLTRSALVPVVRNARARQHSKSGRRNDLEISQVRCYPSAR